MSRATSWPSNPKHNQRKVNNTRAARREAIPRTKSFGEDSEALRDIRGRYGVSRGRDFACEVGRGLFLLCVACRERREYSLCTKASPCQIFCSGGEEQACGTIRVRIVLSTSVVFYLLSCFYLFFLFLLLLLSSFSCRLRGPRFRVQMPFLSRGKTFFIYSFSMQKSLKWASHHLHRTSSPIGSLFCSYYSNFSCEDFSMKKP